MECPSCRAPVLLGISECSCGYRRVGRAKLLPIDVSYWEAVRAYWRIYWRSELLVCSTVVVSARAGLMLTLPTQLLVFSIGLLFSLPALVSSSYRGFSIQVVISPTGQVERGLNLLRRAKVWLFIWWRLMAGGLLAYFALGPLAVLLSLLGFRIADWVAVPGGILIVGPIVVMMLVGTEFDDFRLEVKRIRPERS